MKKRIKRNKRVFMRSATITLVVIFCIAFGVYGICLAFCGTRQIAYGDYRSAVEFYSDGFRILDFEVKF